VIAAAAPECVDEAHLAAACAAWWAGAPLWLEGAAAAWAGAWRCTGTAPRTAGDPEDLGASEAAQIASARAVLADSVPLTRGLGLLPVGIEPRVLEDAGWNRLFSLAYAHPVQPAFGIGSGTTLVVTAAGARVLGSESVLSLDLRLAARTRARNGAYVVANGLLDVFAPGDDVSPVAAPAGLVSLRRIQRQRIPRPERSAVGWS
jgi:hypothetical protein